jgi:tRNA threonylcarbamoyladenosine biosynthesis protein TsaE
VTASPGFELDLPDIGATSALAARIAGAARQGDVIALAGPLGSGKTSFARAFIAARCGAAEVPSPTFTLVEIYAGAPPIWHFDLFRLDAPKDAWELGLEDALADAISLIEWPERLGPLMPRERLAIALAFAASPDARRATIAPSHAWRQRITELALG